MKAGPRKSGVERAKTHREKLRSRGLRPIQIWVPDTRTAAFAQEARRQSRAVAGGPGEADDQAFIDAIAALAED